MQNHTKIHFIEYSNTFFYLVWRKKKSNFLIHVVLDERSVNIDGSKTNIRARSTHDPIRKREINGLWIIAYYNSNIIFEDEKYDSNVFVSLFFEFQNIMDKKYQDIIRFYFCFVNDEYQAS